MCFSRARIHERFIFIVNIMQLENFQTEETCHFNYQISSDMFNCLNWLLKNKFEKNKDQLLPQPQPSRVDRQV